eukprot:scaffold115276_cov48-Phaeocystis_antarctica.AAC.1
MRSSTEEIVPAWSKAAKSAALEAASSSTRGSGQASSWECRATQSSQGRPEEAQEPSWDTAKAGTLNMLWCR